MFEWDEANIGHIAKHDVLPSEAEEVIDNDPLDLEVQLVEDEERMLLIGSTRTGRILMVATTWRADALRVVTAFPAPPALRQLYLTSKGGRR